MPIMKDIETFAIPINKEENLSVEEAPQLLPDNNAIWPELPGAQGKDSADPSVKDAAKSDSSDEWENLSSDPADSPKREAIIKSFPRCVSTPAFSNLGDEDDSYVLDCAESVDAQSMATTSSAWDDAVLVSQKKTADTMKKVPSFKDIMMLNAQANKAEEQNKKEILQHHQDKMREAAVERRKSNKPRLVVNAIQRCAKSTGDLRSLVIHEDAEDDGGGGGGGGGTIHEDEVTGDTDSMCFYHQKSKGSLNRQNGSKIRPDEAKRRDFIMHKKNAQRAAQQK